MGTKTGKMTLSTTTKFSKGKNDYEDQFCMASLYLYLTATIKKDQKNWEKMFDHFFAS